LHIKTTHLLTFFESKRTKINQRGFRIYLLAIIGEGWWWCGCLGNDLVVHGGSVTGPLELARWCQERGLGLGNQNATDQALIDHVLGMLSC